MRMDDRLDVFGVTQTRGETSARHKDSAVPD